MPVDVKPVVGKTERKFWILPKGDSEAIAVTESEMIKIGAERDFEYFESEEIARVAASKVAMALAARKAQVMRANALIYREREEYRKANPLRAAVLGKAIMPDMKC